MIRESEIKNYKDKMVMELIRVKLGRFLKNHGLRFERDARDNSEEYFKNKSILDMFDEYYNNYKIVCTGYKGTMVFAIFNKSKYNKDLWDKINEWDNVSDWNETKIMKNKYSAEYATSWDDLPCFTTTEIIFNLIRICNDL